MYETALGADEIITSVDFPVPKKAAYVKFPNPASRFALVGVFVAQTADGRARRGDRRGAGVFPREADRGGAREELHADAAKAVEGRRARAQHRPARLARVPRAPDRGDGRARVSRRAT